MVYTMIWWYDEKYKVKCSLFWSDKTTVPQEHQLETRSSATLWIELLEFCDKIPFVVTPLIPKS
jgi:hypothetical protein